LSAENRDIVSRFQKAGYDVTLMDMTLDAGIPTVLAISRGQESDTPALVPAGSASLDPEDAIRKSLEELEHTREYCHKIQVDAGQRDGLPEGEEINDQSGHLRFWCSHEHVHLADFLFRSQIRKNADEIVNLSTGDARQDLQRLLTKVGATGHRVLLSELTTPDVADCGLSVIRAMIPGYHPLVVGHNLRSLGGERLWTVPQLLGHEGVTRTTGDNPVPHPYP
jgi:ribosomal protein S12 methylthiotransferase accessory factor